MGPDSNQLDRQIKESWRDAALRWERWADKLAHKSAPVSEWLVDAIDPQPGQRVLELAAGPGDTGFLAAERIGPSGRLICSDQAESMVEVARRRAAARGLQNVEFAVLDGQRIDLEDASVDAVICRWGYMLMADRVKALRETRRVLKPGAPLALAVWAGPDLNPWLVAVAGQLIARGALPLPEPGAPGVFALADPALVEAWLNDGGMSEVEVDRVDFQQRYDSFDAFWQSPTSRRRWPTR